MHTKIISNPLHGVGARAVGAHFRLELRIAQQREEVLTVGVVEVDILPTIATRRRVIQHPRKNSSRSGGALATPLPVLAVLLPWQNIRLARRPEPVCSNVRPDPVRVTPFVFET